MSAPAERHEDAAAAGVGTSEAERPEPEHVERLVLIARLKPGALERAEELAADEIAAGTDSALVRGWTFLSRSEVVFMIEGADVDLHTREWFDDPVLSTAFSSWLALFESPLHRAQEIATWSRRAP